MLDYEKAASQYVTVKVTDSGGNTYAETFTIALVDVNEAPIDLSLSGNTVAENAANGTTVGTVTATDPDAGDTATYALIDNAGGRFAIDPNSGAITVADGALLDYDEASSHNVTVQVTDSAGNTYSEAFAISVTDVTELIVTAANMVGNSGGFDANHQPGNFFDVCLE